MSGVSKIVVKLTTISRNGPKRTYLGHKDLNLAIFLPVFNDFRAKISQNNPCYGKKPLDVVNS